VISMSECRDAKAARKRAAEYLADAVAFEAGGHPAEALLAFEAAINDERWAVYYEERAAEHAARSTGKR